MTEFTSKWLTWEPPETLKVGTDKSAKSPPATLETSRVRTDKTDRSPFGSFVSSYSTHSQGNVAALDESTDEGPDLPPNCQSQHRKAGDPACRTRSRVQNSIRHLDMHREGSMVRMYVRHSVENYRTW